MSITLYYNPYSTRCISVKCVLLVTKSDFNEKPIDVLKDEHLQPAFANINPNQTVPAITEGFFSLFESHSILKYITLSRQDFTLYPNVLDINIKDLLNKALVDSYLDWQQTQFLCILNYTKECYLKPLLIGNKIPQDRVQKLVDVDETLTFFVQVFLKNGEWNYIFNQPNYTIADIRAACDLTSLFLANFDFEKFPIIEAYLARMFKIQELHQSHQEFFSFIQKQKYKNQFIQSVINKTPKLEQITLYFHPLSPPSRAVRSLLLLAQIEYNEKVIDILKSENKSEIYTKINPNQTVPSIKQGQFTLFESHAILKYICDQYRLSNYYPTDFQIRAKIDSYLDFHHNEMKFISEYVMKYFVIPNQMKTEIPAGKEEVSKKVEELLNFFVKVFLNEGKYQHIWNNKTQSIADLRYLQKLYSALQELLFLMMANYDFSTSPAIQKYITSMLENVSVKQAAKEYLQVLSSQQINYNSFNKQVITTSKKKGCC